MSSDSYFKEDRDLAEESKLLKKARESPFMIIGIVGFIGAGIYGAYKYKNRGGMGTSVYLMQLRVIAQSAVVGSLTVGLAYTMAKEHLFKDKTPKEK